MRYMEMKCENYGVECDHFKNCNEGIRCVNGYLENEFDIKTVNMMLEDDKKFYSHLLGFWLAQWWDTQSIEDEEKMIERAFNALSEEEKVSAFKKVAELSIEQFAHVLGRNHKDWWNE